MKQSEALKILKGIDLMEFHELMDNLGIGTDCEVCKSNFMKIKRNVSELDTVKEAL